MCYLADVCVYADRGSKRERGERLEERRRKQQEVNELMREFFWGISEVVQEKV